MKTYSFELKGHGDDGEYTHSLTHKPAGNDSVDSLMTSDVLLDAARGFITDTYGIHCNPEMYATKDGGRIQIWFNLKGDPLMHVSV